METDRYSRMMVAVASPPRQVGRDPNEARASLLQDSLKSFIQRISELPHSEELQEVLTRADEETLYRWFQESNKIQSQVNTNALQKITTIFALLITTNDGIQTSQPNLNQLYGVLQCSIMAGSEISGNIRAAVEKLETAGNWTLTIDEEELAPLSVYIAWDYLAWFCTEVVQFCTTMIRCGELSCFGS